MLPLPLLYSLGKPCSCMLITVPVLHPLGMFKFNNQEYCYDWAKTIIKNETGENLSEKKIKRNKKKTIPKKRNLIINSFINHTCRIDRNWYIHWSKFFNSLS